MQLVTISKIKLSPNDQLGLVQSEKENDNKINMIFVITKKYNQAYDIIKHSRHLVINLAKM